MLWEEMGAKRDLVSLGAVALDQDFTIAYVSSGMLSYAGLTADAVVGLSAMNWVHPDDLERAASVLQEVRAVPAERPAGMYRLRLRDEAYEQFAVHNATVAINGESMTVLEFHHPSERERAEALADDAVDAMRLLSLEIGLEDSLHGVALIAERHVAGLQLVTTLFNAEGVNTVVSRQQIPKKLQEANEAAQPEALPIHVEMALAEFHQGPWRSPSKIARPDFILPGRLTAILAGRSGEFVGYVEALRPTSAPPDGAEWRVHGMISRMMTAVVQRHHFDQELRRAADVDSLTGLLNRRKLFELLNADTHLAGSLLYLIDLDRFSWVNNNLGHKAGDETLVGIAQSLMQVCPDEAIMSRLGGDEFVVWVPADQAAHDLETLGSKISKAMAVPAGIGDKRVWVRASIGMVRVAVGESGADAVNRADLAMYASKRGGGDAVTAG